MISSMMYSKVSLKTEDKPMVSHQCKVIDTQLNLGELVEPLLEFQESVVQVLIDLVKPPSVICVEKVECSPHYTYGEDGIEK